MLISPEVAHESSQLIILGRGIELVDGTPVLGQGSQERAEHAAGYYAEHRDVFNEEAARIVCSGGFPRLSDEEFGPTSEGSMMADVLVKHGVPHQLIETETQSRSTLQNFLFSAPMLNLDALAEERPLGVVSHAGHFRRAADVAHKVLGSETPLSGLITPGEEGARWQVQEHVMRNLWRVVLAGVAEGDTATLLAREAQITHVASALRRPLSLIIK